MEIVHDAGFEGMHFSNRTLLTKSTKKGMVDEFFHVLDTRHRALAPLRATMGSVVALDQII
jgi:hypothetical protein